VSEPIPQRFEDLTPDFVTALLRRAGVLAPAGGRVTRLAAEPLGAGLGFVGALARLRLEYAGTDGQAPGPASVIVKVPGTNRTNRALVELGQGHEREVRFYRELAPRCGIATPAVYAAEYDPDPREDRRAIERSRFERLPHWLMRCLLPLALWRAGRSRRRYLLVLEDVSRGETRDQIEGGDAGTARRVAHGLAGLHARHWDDPALEALDWLPRPDWTPRSAHVAYRSGRRRFERVFDGTLPDSFLRATDWVDAHVEAILARLSARPRTLLHGDFRLDNLLFDGSGVVAVDWQSVAVGRGALDQAYFAMGSLSDAAGEQDEMALLEAYHAGLVAGGVTDHPLEACRRDYLLAKLLVAYGNVAATRFLSLQGDRGDALLDTIRRRLVARVPAPPFSWLL